MGTSLQPHLWLLAAWDDHINTRTMLQNMVRHPNAGRCWWLALAVENNKVEAFRETLGEFDPQRVHFMVCQHQDDEVEAGVEHLHQLYEVMRQDKRQPGKLSELKFGLECGDRTACRALPLIRCWAASQTMRSPTAALPC